MAEEQTMEAAETKEEKKKLVVNIVSVEDSGLLKKKVTVEIPREEIDKRMNENYSELGKSAQVPGFRIGRAPRKLIERRFGKDIKEQVRLLLISDGVEQAIEKSELQTLSEPDLKLEDITLPDTGPMTFSFEVEIRPEIDLPKLEGIELEEKDIAVVEKDIDSEIDNFRWQMAKLVEASSDGKTEKNDILEADIAFEVADEPPIVKHGTQFDVRPCPFEEVWFKEAGEQLAGMSIGDTKTIETTVPDTHEKESWRGKTAKLTLTVKKISRWTPPEISDEIIDEAGYDTMEAWRVSIKTELESKKGMQSRKDMDEQLKKYLLENTKVDIPDGLAERQTDRVLYRRLVELRQMGVSPILIENKLDTLRTGAKTEAVNDLKFFFVASQIAKGNDMKVSEEEVNGSIASIAGQYGRRPERMREEMVRQGTIGYIYESILERKVLDNLREKAKIVKGQPKKDDKK
jgi:trigger factor